MSRQLAAGDLLRCRAWCSDTGQASVNTFYYNVDSVIGSSISDLEFAAIFSSAVAPRYKNLIVNGVIFNGVQVQVIQPGPLQIAADYTGDTGVGTAGAPGLPRQATGLIDWQTQTAGPGYRGRTFVPFPDVTHNTNEGVPTASYSTLINALANSVFTMTLAQVGADGVNCTLVIFSRVHNARTPVTAFFGRGVWATIKKRGSLGRPNLSPI